MKRGRLRIRSRRGGEGEASSPVMRKSQRACAAGEWGRPPSSILFAGCSGSPSSNPFFNLIHQRGICPPSPSPLLLPDIAFPSRMSGLACIVSRVMTRSKKGRGWRFRDWLITGRKKGGCTFSFSAGDEEKGCLCSHADVKIFFIHQQLGFGYSNSN